MDTISKKLVLLDEKPNPNVNNTNAAVPNMTVNTNAGVISADPGSPASPTSQRISPSSSRVSPSSSSTSFTGIQKGNSLVFSDPKDLEDLVRQSMYLDVDALEEEETIPEEDEHEAHNNEEKEEGKEKEKEKPEEAEETTTTTTAALKPSVEELEKEKERAKKEKDEEDEANNIVLEGLLSSERVSQKGSGTVKGSKGKEQLWKTRKWRLTNDSLGFLTERKKGLLKYLLWSKQAFVPVLKISDICELNYDKKTFLLDESCFSVVFFQPETGKRKVLYLKAENKEEMVKWLLNLARRRSVPPITNNTAMADP